MVIPPDRPDRLDAEKSLAALSACVANAVGFPLAIGPAGECKVSYPEKLCGRKGHQCPLWVNCGSQSTAGGGANRQYASLVARASIGHAAAAPHTKLRN